MDKREPSKGLKLHYIEPEIVNAQKVVNITSNDIKEEVAYWEASLMGYLIGHVPKLAVIRPFVEKR